MPQKTLTTTRSYLYIENIKYERRLAHLAHERQKLRAHVRKLLRLILQLILDIGRARENAVQVHPPPLHVNPDVKDGIHAVELVLPAERLLLELLVVGRELHGRHAVHVLAQLAEQLVPAADQLALALVADGVERVAAPVLAHLLEELLERLLALRHRQRVLDDELVGEQVDVPDGAWQCGEGERELEVITFMVYIQCIRDKPCIRYRTNIWVYLFHYG